MSLSAFGNGISEEKESMMEVLRNRENYSPMVPEMILSSESFPTQITRKWAFVRVCAFVNQEVIRFGKMTTTVLADKFFLGSEKNVHMNIIQFQILSTPCTNSADRNLWKIAGAGWKDGVSDSFINLF